MNHSDTEKSHGLTMFPCSCHYLSGLMEGESLFVLLVSTALHLFCIKTGNKYFHICTYTFKYSCHIQVSFPNILVSVPNNVSP